MELGGFLPTVKRWWWLLLFSAVLAGMMGYSVASGITPTYEAEVRLLVGPINTDERTLEAAGRLAQTYAELATSTPLLESTIADLEAPVRATTLRNRVDASANELTRILTVRVRDEDAVRAATLSNTLADKLVERTDGGPNRLEGSLEVIDRATAPTGPVAPQVPLIVVLATFAGLLAGLGLALLLERLRDTVASAREAAALTGTTVLATLRAGNTREPLVVEDAPRSETASAYRLLSARVQFLDDEHLVRSLLVLGCRPGDGSGEVAANLAVALAVTGKDVTLVDLNHDGREVSDVVGMPPLPGWLRRFFADGDLRPERLRLDFDRVISVLPADPDAPEQAMSLGRAGALLDRALSESGMVVVNTEATRRSSDAVVWARAVDAVLLVATRDRTGRRELADAAGALRSVGSPIIGTVLYRRRRWSRGRPPAVSTGAVARPRGAARPPRPAPAEPAVTRHGAVPVPRDADL